ncbi:hypothetical protein GA0070606_4557 [Micromonospora citrea]|uniref:HEAT repeat-containing protein n=1 Tax=Micromonospora citrea TaxID=47855 RepID=A0A1C6VM92_9ACTN|nr:hypothetical protein [Micromonospora citrea]SCL67458.1 hypothetical protein GA0070606_4557 [Micromonospora citrea]
MDVETLLPRSRTPRDYLDVVADPRVDAAGMRVLARSPYPFVRLAVAEDVRADAVALRELLAGSFSEWDRNRLLRLVARHPQADRGVLLDVLKEIAARLDRRTSRPYAAAIAVAGRRELAPHEVRRLQRLPGASRRMRRGVERALAARADEETRLPRLTARPAGRDHADPPAAGPRPG